MKKFICAVLAGSLTLGAMSTAVYCEDENVSEKVVEIHVSPTGTDTNKGTESSPLRSLEGARKRVASVKNIDTEVRVIFHGGEYRMTESVNFSASDSGYEGNPIVYMAADGEKPVFKGSILLNTAKFTDISDESVYDRLPETTADKVAQLDLKSQGVVSISDIPQPGSYGANIRDYHKLYLDGIEQSLSRWPNNGFAKMGKIVDAGNGVFEVSESNASRWKETKDVMFAGFPAWDWAYDRVRVMSVNTEKRQVYLNAPRIFGGKISNSSARYFIYNILEELDEPGEWYIDSDTLKLYYYPMYPVENATLELSVLSENFVNLTDVSNLVFDGLEFTQGMCDAFYLSGCNNIKFTDGSYHDLGRSAVNSGGTKEDKKIEVSGNVIRNMGSWGISLYSGSMDTLEESGNVVSNNQLTRCGQTKRSYAGGVSVNGVGMKVEHNVIYDMPHEGIAVKGALNKISYNEISDVCQEANDMGAIYSGRKAYWRGNEVSYNYIHDLVPAEGLAGLLCGVYWDDSLSGEIVHHNIFKNVPRSVFKNGGCDDLIENNIVIDSTLGIQIGYISGNRTQNLEVFQEGVNMANQYPVYYEKFPDMKNIDLTHTSPHNNRVLNNYMVNAYGSAITDIDNEEFWGDDPNEKNISKGNVSVSDYSAFVDPENGNYEIKSDAEILEQIPELASIKMDEIGLLKDVTDDFENDKFIKIHPKNGEKNVSTSGFYLKWQPGKYHTVYHVVIAEDKNLEKVVFEKDTNDNYAYFDGLSSGGKTYYWNVTASSGIVTNGTGEKSSYGAVYSFQTPNREKLDQVILSESLTNAESLFATLSPGKDSGQCEQKIIDEYSAIIEEAKTLNKKKFGDQAEVDAMNEKLSSFTAEMPRYIYKGYASLENWLSSDKNWQFVGSDACGMRENQLHIVAGAHVISNERMRGYQVYKFKAKSEVLSNMFVIALNIQGPGNPWNGYGYSLYLKKNLFELQRYNNGGGILETKENTGVFTPGEWADIEVGALNVMGGIQVYLKINDEEIFNFYDESGIISKDGFLQFSCYGGTDDTLDIAAVEELGVFDSSIIVGGEKEYKEPELFGKEKLVAANIEAQGGNVSETEEGIYLSGNGADNYFKLNGDFEGNEMFDFVAKLNLESGGQAIGIRGKDDAEEYRVFFDNEKIELRRISKNGTQPLFITDNDFIKSGELANIRLVSFDTEKGTRIALYVNSQKVFDCTDWYSKIKTGGLKFYDTNMKGMVIK